MCVCGHVYGVHVHVVYNSSGVHRLGEVDICSAKMAGVLYLEIGCM